MCLSLSGCTNICQTCTPQPVPPPCPDPCANLDNSKIHIHNSDNTSTIFIKYYNLSDDGDYIQQNSPLPTINTSIGPGADLNLDFHNDHFNHFYFYKDNSYTDVQQLGVLIIKNTLPQYTSLCTINIRLNGNFPAGVKTPITNVNRRAFCVRSAGIFNQWTNWDLQNPQGDNTSFSDCGTVGITLPQATDFKHVYFYPGSSNCGAITNDNNNLSKIIYRNNNSSKIQLSNIVIRLQ